MQFGAMRAVQCGVVWCDGTGRGGVKLSEQHPSAVVIDSTLRSDSCGGDALALGQW